MQKIYFIKNYHRPRIFLHGGVGYYDAEEILEKIGFIPIDIPFYNTHSFIFNSLRLIYVYCIIWKFKKDDKIIALYPIYPRAINILLRCLLRYRKVHLTYIVMDINGVKDGIHSLLQKEIHDLKQATQLVVHNEKMKTFLIEYLPKTPMYSLDFFDYLNFGNNNPRPKLSHTFIDLCRQHRNKRFL